MKVSTRATVAGQFTSLGVSFNERCQVDGFYVLYCYSIVKCTRKKIIILCIKTFLDGVNFVLKKNDFFNDFVAFCNVLFAM